MDALNSFFASVDGVLLDKSQTTVIQYPPGKAGSYTVPVSVTSIGERAFYGCHGLTSITIDSDVTISEWGAFATCTNLTRAILGNGVTGVWRWAFSYCPSLNNVTLGSSITRIGTLAFVGCASLSSITIPKSVTFIGDWAFDGCTELAGVYFQANIPSLGPFIFAEGVKATVYYLPGTTGWGPMIAGRPTVLWNPKEETGDGNFGVRSNQFGFTITGTSNLVIVVEACTNLATPAWSVVGTNTLTGGASYFSDPQWTNHPSRFYRLRSP